MKLLKTEIIALCDYASVSREGKLSINGIFDELRVQKFPGGIARAFLVATVNGTPNTQYRLNLKVEDKNGGKSPINDLVLNAMTAPNGKNNLIIELVNLVFEKEGDYQFKIYNGNQEVGSTLLKVFHFSGTIENKKEKLPN
ncbi:MAG: hypothetical protein Q8Q96_01205 [bacterium]|nr:hypothetical protein [bacterium]